MESYKKIGLEVVEMCRNGQHDAVIKLIVNNSSLRKYIRKFCKDKDERQTILHDTILSFIRTCMNPDFKITGSPIAYMKVIARNIMLAEKRKNKIVTNQLNVDFPNQVDYYQINRERRDLLNELLEEIPEDCRKILNLWAMKFKMSEISKELGISSIPYTKKKKSVCLKKLIKLVENNPKLKKELRLYV